MSSHGRRLWRAALMLAGILTAMSVLLAVSPLKLFAELSFQLAGAAVFGCAALTSTSDMKELLKSQNGWITKNPRVWDSEEIGALSIASRVSGAIMSVGFVFIGVQSLLRR